MHEPTTEPTVWDGRAELLDDLTRYIRSAWESFEHPRPAEPHVAADLSQRLTESLPQRPAESTQVLADAVSVLDSSISPSRPLFLAYIGSSGLEAGVLASALSAVYDVNLATSAGAADALDAQTVRWLGEFFGYPVAEGHFTSGGQISNFTGVLVARENALPGTRTNGVPSAPLAVYCSAEAHHSNVRAVEAAGLGSRSIRKIPIDANRRMDAADLERQLAADVAAGVTPVAVIATAGTTLSGAVDPLDAIADVCERYGVWLHVDGAYGLPAAVSPQTADLFRGLERADSVTVDIHKWMGLQKSCSLFMVRHRGALVRAFGHDEQYMLHDQDSVNPVDRTFEYSRPFRALKPWLALKLYGADQFRTWIDHTIDLARQFTEAVRAHDRFELLHDPQLSTICFRALHVDEAKRNEFNSALAAAAQRDGRVFLASASIDEHTCLRVTFVNYRTTADDTASVLTVLDELATELAASFD